MNNRKSVVQLLSVLLLSMGFVFVFYGDIVLSPNKYQFSNKGDAIKNYYTYAYYIKQNQSAINFEGLNYPYGEHFLYTDCTPILSVTLKNLTKVFPDLPNYSIGIINFLLIISFIFTVLLIYLILKELKVNPWFAAISALAIMVLSPQIFRLYGHLALGFGFFLPLSWYLLLKYEQNKESLKYAVYLLISVLIIFFIHAYMGMIAASFLFGYLLIKLLFDLKFKTLDRKYYFTLLGIIFTPIIIFRLFVFLSDTHTGRTDNPSGFFHAHATPQSVFLPTHSPLKPLIENIFGHYKQTWEGWAYIGIVSVVLILVYLFLSGKNSFKQKKLTLKNQWFDNRHLQIVLLSSILILLFSMALPFRLHLEWLLDYVAVLKQFRAVGRFAWIFYFAITISSIYFIDRLSKHYFAKNKKIIALLLLIIIPGIYLAEGLPYHFDASKRFVVTSNMFDKNQLDKPLRKGIEQINTDDYQAIFPMPFFYIGSENFGKNGTNKIYLLSQIISYHTSLPVMGSYLTRTSIWESKNIMQLLSPGFYKKEILNDIPLKKPFLLVYSNEYLSTYEQRILDMATLVYKNDDFSFFSLKTEDLFYNNANEEIEQFLQIKEYLFLRDGFLTTDTNSFFFYEDFEESPLEIAFRGNGAYTGLKKKFHKLASIDAGILDSEEKYIASFWLYNQGENYGQDMTNAMFILQEKHDDKTDWTTLTDPTYSMCINGDWSLVELEFKLKYPGAKVDFLLKGQKLSKKHFYIDDLLIYKSDVLNYKIESGNDSLIKLLFKNNHQIKMQ